MERRHFLTMMGMAGAGTSLLSNLASAKSNQKLSFNGVESRRALHELIDTILEADSRFLGDEWGITDNADVADGQRLLMHLLEQALNQSLEADPERPVFKRSVTPTMKLLGDNPDAVYFHASIRGDRRYRIRGNMAGAVYLSVTVQSGKGEGKYADKVGADVNDTALDIADDGSYEVILSSEKFDHSNWLALPADADDITLRLYFEESRSVADDYARHIPMIIEPIDNPGPPPTPNDSSIAAGIRRVVNYFRGRTLEQVPAHKMPEISWVSRVPNHIPKPQKPGKMAFAAVDNAYSMFPYQIGPDEALVITGRFPACRFANVVLWNRFMQSYNYSYRNISLNRKQTQQDSEGRFKIIVSHHNPGLPNWLDTEGRESGVIYWRFLLPEGNVETPVAELMKLKDVS